MKFIIIGLIFVAITGVGAFLILQEPSDTSEANGPAASSSNSKNDNTVKSDLSRAASQFSNYQANNNGKLPDNPNILYEQQYLGDDFTHPDTDRQYVFVTELESIGEIEYSKGFNCNGDSVVVASSARSFALRVYLSDEAIFCVDNS